MSCRINASRRKCKLPVIFLKLLGIMIIAVSCTENYSPRDTLTTNRPGTTVNRKSLSSNLFGIPTDSFNTIRGTVKPNRNLSDILLPYGITPGEIYQLIKSSDKVFSVKQIRAGHNYLILLDDDSIGKLRYFIYEHEPGLHYIFSFNDSLNVTIWRSPTSSVIKFTSFSIETSLWDAMKESGVNPELAIALSDIFAWTVDFFGLQKGDKFKVIYEEKHTGDDYIAAGRIYGASFKSGNRNYMAIPFIQEGHESYYDSDGTSLKKAFLKAPLKFSRITSRYSSARLHPILRIVKPHYGVDYAAPVGTPVYSIGDGKIIETGSDNEGGRYVKIKHNSVYSTAYLHLNSFARGISTGMAVKQGDIIGYVGSSGLSTGPHLDFRFYKNGYPVDPLKVEAPSVEPVREENMEKFNKIKSVITLLLNQID